MTDFPRPHSDAIGRDPRQPYPAVILAAGRGERLTVGEPGVPKPLTPLLGLGLLERSLLSCRQVGVTDYLIVLGHRKDEIRPRVEAWAAKHGIHVDVVENSRWEEGNGTSVLACAPLLSTPFLLLMCDHLFDPRLLQRLIAEGTDGGLCYLLVDRRVDRVFDIEDATRVRLEGDAIVGIGKGLDVYDGVDAGIFLCRPVLFDALKEAGASGDGSLTGGIRRLVERGRMRAVDLGEGFWLDVDTPRDVRHARRVLPRQVVKTGEDGFVAELLNRRLSVPISKWLLSWRALAFLTPNVLSMLSFLIVVVGAVLLGLKDYAAWLSGGILVQFGSILDGCDGEVARLTFRASRFGGWFDTLLDRYADAAVTAGVTYAFWRLYPSAWVWLGGLVSLAGFLLASYSKKEYALRYRESVPAGALMRLVKRDLRLFLVFLGAIAGYPYYAMLAVGLLSHWGVVRLVWAARSSRIA